MTGRTTPTTRKKAAATVLDRKRLVALLAGEIGEEPQIESALLQDLHIDDDRLANGRIERSLLDGVTLIGAESRSLLVRGSRFERCDLSASVMEATALIECALDGCKLAGTRLDRAVLEDVVFTECRADLLQLQHARLRRVRFERCQLRGAFFNGAAMPGTIFEACDLSGADFSGADITGSDLRRSRIEGIRVAPDQLQGVVVTHDQALYLAGLLGLVIRDE